MKRLALIAALILLTASQARAAKPTPGTSCAGQNTGAFITSGGQETGGILYFLICDGTNWQPVGIFNHASSNAGLGYGVLYASGGTDSTAIGDGALSSAATDANTAVGYKALNAATTGHHNTAVGANALVINTNGAGNVAVGFDSLFKNVSGGNNIALGENALYNTTNGDNTAIGYQALLALTTGGDNTGIGYSVGSATLATGNNNILIGTSNAVDTPASGTSNFLNIGNTIFATSTMTGTVAAPAGNVGIGTATPAGTLDVEGGTAAAMTNGSDIRIVAQNPGAGGNNSGGVIYLIPGGNTGSAPPSYVSIPVDGGSGLVVDSGSARVGLMKYNNFTTGLVGQTAGVDNNISVWLGRWSGSGINAPSSFNQDLVIKTNGNVGIGTTSPAAPLHVNGEAIVGMDALACSGTTAGAIRYNSSSKGMEYCDRSAWFPFDYCTLLQPYTGSFVGGGYPVNGLWNDGTYFYSGSAADLEAFTYNNATHAWTNGAYTNTPANDNNNIWGDGTYIYLSEATSGIQAYTFNGTTFTLKGTYNTTMNADWVWGDGTYIYVADDTHGLRAFTFNGTTFTLKGTVKPASMQATTVWGDGTYIYVSDQGNQLIRAYTFNGSTFTSKGSHATANYANGIWGDGTYIYATENGAGIEAYTFNGTTFTLKAESGNAGDLGAQVIGKNGDLYSSAGAYIEVDSFNGTSFTYKGMIPTYNVAGGFWTDSNNIYFVDSYGPYIAAYPLCH